MDVDGRGTDVVVPKDQGRLTGRTISGTQALLHRLGAVFTVVSIARSSALRRLFEAIRMRGA